MASRAAANVSASIRKRTFSRLSNAKHVCYLSAAQGTSTKHDAVHGRHQTSTAIGYHKHVSDNETYNRESLVDYESNNSLACKGRSRGGRQHGVTHMKMKSRFAEEHLSGFTFERWVTTAVFVPAFAFTAALLTPRLAIAFSISRTSLDVGNCAGRLHLRRT